MNSTKFQAAILVFCILQTVLLGLLIGSVTKLTGAFEKGLQDKSGVSAALPMHSADLIVSTAVSHDEIMNELRKIFSQQAQAALDTQSSLKERESKPTPAAAAPMIAQDRLSREAAIAEASLTVENALIRGQWTQDDTFRFIMHGSALPKEEHDRLRDKILNAINNQELSLESIPIFY